MHGQDLSSDVNTAQLGTSASMLSIESVDYHHSGEYTCMASNQAGTTTYTATLRVNGRQRRDAMGSQALGTLGFINPSASNSEIKSCQASVRRFKIQFGFCFTFVISMFYKATGDCSIQFRKR